MAMSFTKSFSVAKKCLQVMMEDKKILIFPVLSVIGILVALISFVIPIITFDEILLAIPAFFAFYFAAFFVAIFFNSALIHAATEKLEGKQVSISGSISFAFSKILNILLWTVIAATIGMIFGILRALSEGKGILNLVFRFLVAGISIAWSLATFFVIPVMVFENVGPLSAMKRSKDIFKKHWSEQIIGDLTLGLHIFLIYLIGVLIIVVGFIVVPALALLLVPLGILVIFLAFVVQGAAQAIFLAELYRYSISGQSVIFADEIDEVRGKMEKVE